MKIFPAIDIINGECVRLTKGLAENKTIYDKSPVEMAKIYQDKGFETIHVVDLDATLGKGNNDKTLELIRKNININIEVAGGIRDKIAIQNKINQGCLKIWTEDSTLILLSLKPLKISFSKFQYSYNS